jgi:hypothetical protein
MCLFQMLALRTLAVASVITRSKKEKLALLPISSFFVSTQ